MVHTRSKSKAHTLATSSSPSPRPSANRAPKKRPNPTAPTPSSAAASPSQQIATAETPSANPITPEPATNAVVPPSVSNPPTQTHTISDHTMSSNAGNPDTLAAIMEKLTMMDKRMQEFESRRANKDKRRKAHNQENSDSDDDHYAPRNRSHFTKMKFPKFSCGDPRGWILKAEKYFRHYGTPDREKVDVASMYLEDAALDLYSWLETKGQLYSWHDLVVALELNFGQQEYQNPDQNLCKVRQTGTVTEYREEFTRRSARTRNWPEHCLLGLFLAGLKDEIADEVTMHRPTTVYEALGLALEYERKLSSPDSRRQPVRNQDNNHTRYAPSVSSSSRTYENSTSNSKQFLPASSTEYQHRKDKGLCYHCGETFKPGHRCLSKLTLMELTKEDKKVAEPPLEDDEEDDATISLNAIMGNSSPTTMTLKGTLLNREVIILVDSGSTHNFISNQVVADLNLTPRSIAQLGVNVGDGRTIECNTLCPALPLKISDLIITEDFYPFNLRGIDMILGIKWLASLKTVQANWNEMFMIFWVNGKKYKLQGVKPKDRPLEAIRKLRLEDKSSLQAGRNDSDPNRYRIKRMKIN